MDCTLLFCSLLVLLFQNIHENNTFMASNWNIQSFYFIHTYDRNFSFHSQSEKNLSLPMLLLDEFVYVWTHFPKDQFIYVSPSAIDNKIDYFCLKRSVPFRWPVSDSRIVSTSCFEYYLAQFNWFKKIWVYDSVLTRESN